MALVLLIQRSATPSKGTTHGRRGVKSVSRCANTCLEGNEISVCTVDTRVFQFVVSVAQPRACALSDLAEKLNSSESRVLGGEAIFVLLFRFSVLSFPHNADC